METIRYFALLEGRDHTNATGLMRETETDDAYTLEHLDKYGKWIVNYDLGRYLFNGEGGALEVNPEGAAKIAKRLVEKDYTRLRWYEFPSRALNKYEQRVDFEKVEGTLTSLHDEADRRLREQLAKTRDDTIRRASTMLPSLSPMEAARFQVVAGPQVADIMRTMLTEGWERGYKETQNELPRAPKAFAGFEPTQAKKFLEAKALNIAGILDAELTKKVQQRLIQYLKGGNSLDDMIETIRRIFEPWVGDPTKIAPSGQVGIGFPPGTMEPENVLMAYRLENMIRTPLTEAYNQGRVSLGDEAGDYVIGYSYSAILDTRTCFAKGTLIEMSDGSQRPIESIKPGESLRSGTGRNKRVLACWRYPATRWRRLTFEDGRSVLCTDTHQFWTQTKNGFDWCQAVDLQAMESLVSAKPWSRLIVDRLPSVWQESPAIQQQPAQVLLNKMLPQLAGDSFAQAEILSAVRKTDREYVLQQNLRIDESRRLDRTDLSEMRQALSPNEKGVESSSWQGRKVLQREMLFQGKGKCSMETMPDMQSALQNSSIKRGSIYHLLEEMLDHQTAKRSSGKTDSPQMLRLSEVAEVYPKAESSEKQASILLSRVPSKTKNSKLSRLWNIVRNQSTRACHILLSPLLSKIASANAYRNIGRVGVAQDESKICKAIPVGEIHAGLLSSRISNSARNGRRILAQEPTRIGCSERSGSKGKRNKYDSVSREDGCSWSDGRFTAKNADHSHQPISEHTIRLISNEPVDGVDWAYDLEIENDHCYLANGLVAHNTEICRQLDQQIIRKDDGRVQPWLPPNHYQCRSLITYITTDDIPVEWSSDAEIDAALRNVPDEFQ